MSHKLLFLSIFGSKKKYDEELKKQAKIEAEETKKKVEEIYNRNKGKKK